jgi:hypothetical protein
VLSDENVQRYVKAMLPLALLLILVPLGDIALRSMTTEAGSLQWRFGTVGLLFGNLGTIVLGLGLTGFVAAVTGGRNGLRGVAFVAFLIAAIVLALLVLFALDAVQIRRLVAIPMKRGILVSSVGATFSAMFATVALIVLGRGALVASRSAHAAAQRRTKASPSPLVAAGAAPARDRAAERASEPV